jgi:hypothetical protein
MRSFGFVPLKLRCGVTTAVLACAASSPTVIGISQPPAIGSNVGVRVESIATCQPVPLTFSVNDPSVIELGSSVKADRLESCGLFGSVTSSVVGGAAPAEIVMRFFVLSLVSAFDCSSLPSAAVVLKAPAWKRYWSTIDVGLFAGSAIETFSLSR